MRFIKAHDDLIDDDSANEFLISRSPRCRCGSGVVGQATGSVNRQVAGSTDKLVSVAVRTCKGDAHDQTETCLWPRMLLLLSRNEHCVGAE